MVKRWIITNGLRQESVDGFKVYNNKVRTALFKGQFYSGILFPLMNGLNLLNLAIVIAMGSWMIIPVKFLRLLDWA